MRGAVLDITVPLDETGRQAAGAGRMAIRWLTPGAADPYRLIDESRMTVGRGPEVTVPFEAAGLSRSHVEIYRQGPAYIAHDLRSTNGTYVNGRRIEYAPLSEGDVIRLGDVVGIVARVRSDRGPGPAALVRVAPDLCFGPGLETQIDEIGRVAGSDLPVVVVGETGAGKEYVAQAVHALGGRRGKFHPVNCAALPVALAETELFGHSRGAYTGAEQAALGHLRAADGGTLFLDELPELSPAVQAKLLRVLQDRQVTPLGETRAVTVDLRVVVACQQSLEELVQTRRLREDLAARLAGLVVVVPPLRERRIDILLYFRHFLDHYGQGPAPQLDPRLVECLLLHAWPGNVRELDLLARRLVALHGNVPLLRRSFLPEAIRETVPPADPAPPTEIVAGDRDQHDVRRLARALRQHDNNVTRAAAAAGISRSRAYRLMADERWAVRTA